MKMLEEFKQLPVWKRFDATNTEKYNFDTPFNDAISLLDRYYTAFPSYTLHNTRHVKNIIELVGKILGEGVEKLTCLECVIIILSAAYHDIGMVFDGNTLSRIEKEPNFKNFLENNLKAKLQYQESREKLAPALAEWYCRWVHAQRVWLFLDNLDEYKWRNFSLKKPLGDICVSHNNNASTLLDDRVFDINFINEADLRFCAILLRLCDILDFDNSRTPKSVYEFLDLDNPKNKSDEISRDEWNKHLSSNGFIVLHSDLGFELKFTAAPLHPQIEKNIQEFLDVIEDELKKCASVLRTCSSRWREMRLPETIDRSGIVPQNYSKGNYSLSLDENQVLKLLTGENLYNSSFVFIRELLQNAIDSSRMREAFEVSLGNTSFHADPIQIYSWTDQNGRAWIRIDDFGMGLNQYIIKNHLLKKGSSYYNSDYFKIIKHFIKSKTKRDFTPISRFGIGLLSCFMVCEEIEISSYSISIPQTNSEEEKNRLSIHGLQGQYILQSEKERHLPFAMPGPGSEEIGFRENYGTSVALKVSSKKNAFHFVDNLADAVKGYVTCSPIPIRYNQHVIGVNFEKNLSEPFCLQRFYPFTLQEKKLIEQAFNKTIDGECGVEFIPIDITANAANDNIRGQIFLLRLKISDSIKSLQGFTGQIITNRGAYPYIEFKRDFILGSPKKISTNDNELLYETEELHRDVYISLRRIFYKAVNRTRLKEIFSWKFGYFEDLHEGLRLIHNGINFPNWDDLNDAQYYPGPKLSFNDALFEERRSVSGLFVCFGIIYFEDNLLPDLLVSRNGIRRLGFSIYSNLFYATRKLNDHTRLRYQYFKTTDSFSFEEMKGDKLIQNGTWDSEPLFSIDAKFLSIVDLKELNKNLPIRLDVSLDCESFLSNLQTALLKLHFQIQLKIEDYKHFYLELIAPITVSFSRTSLDKFRANLIIEFEGTSVLAHNKIINGRHWLGKWLSENQEILEASFEGYLSDLLNYIVDRSITEINQLLQYLSVILPETVNANFQEITDADYVQEE